MKLKRSASGFDIGLEYVLNRTVYIAKKSVSHSLEHVLHLPINTFMCTLFTYELEQDVARVRIIREAPQTAWPLLQWLCCTLRHKCYITPVFVQWQPKALVLWNSHFMDLLNHLAKRPDQNFCLKQLFSRALDHEKYTGNYLRQSCFVQLITEVLRKRAWCLHFHFLWQNSGIILLRDGRWAL